MRICVILSILAVVMLAHGNPAFGYVVTVEVEGVVTQADTYDGLTLDDSVTIGSTIMTGSFTYDTEAPAQSSGSSGGTYPLISISMSFGNYTAMPDPAAPAGQEPRFDIDAGSGMFLYMVGIPYWTIFSGPCYLNGEPTNMEDLNLSGNCTAVPLQLYGDNDGTITGALPNEDTFPDLSAATKSKGFSITSRFGFVPAFHIVGEITSITVIPEPGTVLLFGLGGLALLRKRGK